MYGESASLLTSLALLDDALLDDAPLLEIAIASAFDFPIARRRTTAFGAASSVRFFFSWRRRELTLRLGSAAGRLATVVTVRAGSAGSFLLISNTPVSIIE